MKQWLKNWGSFAITSITLAVIIITAVVSTNQNISHASHEEVYNRLNRLDNRIERIEEQLITESQTNDELKYRIYLEQAKSLWYKAETAWSYSEYNKANLYIEDANKTLDQIPRVIGLWILLPITLGGMLLLALFIILLIKNKPIAPGRRVTKES